MTVCCRETNKAARDDDFGEAIRGLWRRGPIGGGNSGGATEDNDVRSLIAIIGEKNPGFIWRFWSAQWLQQVGLV